jgi:cytochrome c biogenesis protein CcmG, thiol:disulfide interchange protein DsbE
MAEFESAAPATAPHASASGPAALGGATHRLRSPLLGLVVAAVIIGTALAIGAQSGWETIGTGGVNRSLLPKVGDAAPDFETEDVFGNPVRLSQFRGHPVWLMFWGSWCPPCRAEFPDIQAAYAQLEPQGLRMLGVSLRESPVDAAAYAGANGATFLVLSDPDERDTGSAYPIFNFPTHIFIDRDGIIQSIVLEDMDTEQAVAEATSLLAPSIEEPAGDG